MKKYTFTGEQKTEFGVVVLRRIKRVSDGQLGGWIEKESNLSQLGDAWVADNAQVTGNAEVYAQSV